MLTDIEIPTMFKRDEETHLVIPEMAEGSEWAKDNTATLLTIKLDGELIKIWNDSNGTKKVARKLGDVWFELSGGHPQDKYLWEAYQNSSLMPLPEGYYTAFGPNINGNHQNVDKLQMLRIAPVDAALIVGWGAVRVHRGLEHTIETFYNDIKAELEDSTIEGFVFMWEAPQMVPFKFAKVCRKDFGFSWPIVEEKPILTPSELLALSNNDPFNYVGD